MGSSEKISTCGEEIKLRRNKKMRWEFEPRLETEVEYEQKKTERFERPSPITAIVSSLPLRYSPAGLYIGDGRDVLVVASRYTRDGPQLHIDSSLELIEILAPRIDCLAGYMGSEGISPGFEEVYDRMRRHEFDDVALITGRAGRDDELKKVDMVSRRLFPIFWTEFGGEIRMLDEIGKEALAGRKYLPRSDVYL